MAKSRKTPRVLGVYNVPPLDDVPEKNFERVRIDFTGANGCCDFCHRKLKSNRTIVLKPIKGSKDELDGSKRERQAGPVCADKYSLPSNLPLPDLTRGALSPLADPKRISGKRLIASPLEFDEHEVEQKQIASEQEKNLTYAMLWEQLKRRGGDPMPAVILNALLEHRDNPQTAYWGDVEMMRKLNDNADSPYSLQRLLHVYATVRWIDKCTPGLDEDKPFWLDQRAALLQSHSSPSEVLEQLNSIIAGRSTGKQVLATDSLPLIELQLTMLPVMETIQSNSTMLRNAAGLLLPGGIDFCPS